MEVRSSTWFLALIAAVFLCAGCGGGSTGTGGSGPDDFGVRGKITAPDGTLLANTRVTVLETGDTATSDTTGNFSVLGEFPGESANLLLERGDASATVPLSGLQANAIATVNLELNEGENAARVISISITPLDDPNPAAPTPTPARTDGQGSESEQPTPTVDPTPDPGKRLSLFTGTIRAARGGQPTLRRAKVTIGGTSDTTNSTGSFRLESDASGNVRVRIDYSLEVFVVFLENIPARPVHVNMEIVIDPRAPQGGEPQPGAMDPQVDVVSIKPRG